MTHYFELHQIRYLRGIIIALCLNSTLLYGQGEENSAQTDPIQNETNSTPVAQALVPEGVFATQLAEALKLGAGQGEAKSEELLSNSGIEPKNGWLAEYPVTPEVLGDIEKDITVASDQGKIAMKKNQALEYFNELKAKFGFDVNTSLKVPDGQTERTGNKKIYSWTDREGVIHFTDDYDSIPKDYQKNSRIVTESTLHEVLGVTDEGTKAVPGPEYSANVNPEDISSYYYEQGPPLVTYYPPPDPYNYLYSWVPYPFWSTGFYFTGFYVLNNFHRQVLFNNQPYYVTHHAASGTFTRPLSVGPVNKAWLEHISPESQDHSRWFFTPNAQASARAIVTLNQNRHYAINRTGTNMSQMNTSRPSISSAGNFNALNHAPSVFNTRTMIPHPSFQATPHFGGRILNQPAFDQRTYAPIRPRFYSPPVFAQGPAFRAPNSYGGRAYGGFTGGYGGGFNGGGGFHGGGVGAGGGFHGGHR